MNKDDNPGSLLIPIIILVMLIIALFSLPGMRSVKKSTFEAETSGPVTSMLQSGADLEKVERSPSP